MKIEEEKYEELIVGYLSGNLTEEEKDRLNSWLEEDDRNVAYLNEYRKVWLASSASSNPKGFDANGAFSKFKQRVSASREMQEAARSIRPNPFKFNDPFWRVAAIIVISFGLGFVANYLFSNRKTTSMASFQEIIAPLGSKTQVSLPDHSAVVLNAGSKIRYYSDFGIKNREIWLQGEGYFTVAKNKEKSFIVRAGSLVIKAVGTQFNVKAYPSEGIIETALVEGKVKIERIQTDAHNLKRVAGMGFLNPKERLIYKEDQTEMAVNERIGEDIPYDALMKGADLDISQIPNVSMEKNVDLRPFISWNGKRWIIKEEELGKLAVKLERKYDVKIIFENERLKHIRFSGTLEDESIEQVFKAVSLVSPVRYKIEGKNVFLQYNSQFMSVYDRAYKE